MDDLTKEVAELASSLARMLHMWRAEAAAGVPAMILANQARIALGVASDLVVCLSGVPANQVISFNPAPAPWQVDLFADADVPDFFPEDWA